MEFNDQAFNAGRAWLFVGIHTLIWAKNMCFFLWRHRSSPSTLCNILLSFVKFDVDGGIFGVVAKVNTPSAGGSAELWYDKNLLGGMGGEAYLAS